MFDEKLQNTINKIKQSSNQEEDFKKDFFGEVNPQPQTAFLDWRFRNYDTVDQFITMGDSYFESQYETIWRLLMNTKDHRADGWIFPIMFCTVHGIEVYLKGALAGLKRIVATQSGTPHEVSIRKGHDIRDIYREVKAELKKADINDKSFGFKDLSKEIRLVGNFIDFIYDKTEDLSAFRYSLDSSKRMQFYSVDLDDKDEPMGHITIDLFKFFIWYTKVHDLLDKLGTAVTVYTEKLYDSQLDNS